MILRRSLGRRGLAASALVAGLCAALMLSSCAGGDDKVASDGPGGDKLIPVKVATLSFASRVTPIATVMKAKGIAKKHGFDLQMVPYADGAAYYAAIASGEVDALMSGVGVFQSMYNQGVPIKILATACGMNAQVLSSNPDIKTLEDLKGRKLAATTAFSEFQNLAIEADSQGINLLKDVKVIDTQPADVLLQLKAKRVDAGLTWDPDAQRVLEAVPDLHVVADSAELWKSVTGLDGWELIVSVRQKWLDEAGAKGAKDFIVAMQEAQRFIETDTAEAAQIFKDETKYPENLFDKVVKGGTFKYKIEPIWDGGHAEEVFAQFRASSQAGYAKKVPDNGALYSPK